VHWPSVAGLIAMVEAVRAPVSSVVPTAVAQVPTLAALLVAFLVVVYVVDEPVVTVTEWVDVAGVVELLAVDVGRLKVTASTVNPAAVTAVTWPVVSAPKAPPGPPVPPVGAPDGAWPPAPVGAPEGAAPLPPPTAPPRDPVAVVHFPLTALVTSTTDAVTAVGWVGAAA
jgi:hypothetical protein